LKLPKSVRVFEVGPRDGLQNERSAIPTSAKVDFVNALTGAGFQDIEVSSFVRPDKVPQLSDAAEVFAGIERREGVRHWALVPNAKGLDAARSAGVGHIVVITAATDGFNRANIGMGIEESLKLLGPVIGSARKAGMSVRAYVSTVFGCPYEGEVDPDAGARVGKALLDMGSEEVALSDTIGVAAPTDVERVLDAAERRGIPSERTALHFHDTRGTALANTLAGLQRGITVFDSSAGGLGGCPFAPGATGNLATEDLLFMLNEMKIDTGIRFDAVAGASAIIEKILQRPLPSKARAAWLAKRRG
jgi:isopropylmalate/homocitrate/citramalate synthase